MENTPLVFFKKRHQISKRRHHFSKRRHQIFMNDMPFVARRGEVTKKQRGRPLCGAFRACYKLKKRI
jgi:hypothetical protein